MESQKNTVVFNKEALGHILLGLGILLVFGIEFLVIVGIFATAFHLLDWDWCEFGDDGKADNPDTEETAAA